MPPACIIFWPICEFCAIMLGGGLAWLMRGVALMDCLFIGVA